MSAITSDMISSRFTVRDLNRNPRKVLDAADRFGSVEVHGRDGRLYAIIPRRPKSSAPLPDFATRRRAAGMKMMTKKQSAALDKLIAGE
jgi:hypothetical protein